MRRRTRAKPSAGKRCSAKAAVHGLWVIANNGKNIAYGAVIQVPIRAARQLSSSLVAREGTLAVIRLRHLASCCLKERGASKNEAKWLLRGALRHLSIGDKVIYHWLRLQKRGAPLLPPAASPFKAFRGSR